MTTRKKHYCLLIAAVSLLAAGPAVAVEPIRIMPLGDSITCGTVPGGYRTKLWKDLTLAGYAIDFVGSRSDNADPENLPDPDHNGFPGWRIDQLDANIVSWMQTSKPAVVLLQIGTNDIASNFDLSHISTRLDSLVTHITTTSPQTHLIVAKITPSTNTTWESLSQDYNNNVVANVVAAHANKGELVTLVDMHATVPMTDIADAVHPNQNGYNLMGNAWFGAVQSLGSIHNPIETPEPCSSTLLVCGLIGMGVFAFRKRHKRI